MKENVLSVQHSWSTQGYRPSPLQPLAANPTDRLAQHSSSFVSVAALCCVPQAEFCVAKGYKADCEVIYGDTDSVMVNFKVGVMGGHGGGKGSCLMRLWWRTRVCMVVWCLAHVSQVHLQARQEQCPCTASRSVRR